MSIGELVENFVHAITVAAWIGFLAPIAILLVLYRHSMPWLRHRISREFTVSDGVLIVLCLLSSGALYRIYNLNH